MLSLKSEPIDDSKPLTASTGVRDKLQHRKHLAFSFEMEREPSKPSRGHPSRNSQRSRSDSASVTAGVNGPDIQDAALLAQFAAAAESGMDIDQTYSSVLPPGQYPSMEPSPGFYGNFFHHGSMPASTQLPPLSSLDFPWPHISPQHQLHEQLHYNPHHASSSAGSSSAPYSSSHPVPPPPLSLDTSRGSSSRRGAQGPASGLSHSASSPEIEQTEGERSSITDEKRRRNTAASGMPLPTRSVSAMLMTARTARFRIKKKQKTVNLERSVSDLTGRAEELEREVVDLRRENGWLKEIVMLKGTRFAAANLSHRLALNQVAAAQAANAEASTSASAATSRQDESSDESASSSESDDNAKKKGKGKAKRK